MNILILGGGGREHSLAWAVRQNPKCDQLFCAPGNAGIAEVATCVALNPENSTELLDFCDDNNVTFVIIGPEAPLAAGVADDLREAGILTFGPSKAAARLEASKAFTKEICDACGAPTSAWPPARASSWRWTRPPRLPPSTTCSAAPSARRGLKW